MSNGLLEEEAVHHKINHEARCILSGQSSSYQKQTSTATYCLSCSDMIHDRNQENYLLPSTRAFAGQRSRPRPRASGTCWPSRTSRTYFFAVDIWQAQYMDDVSCAESSSSVTKRARNRVLVRTKRRDKNKTHLSWTFMRNRYRRHSENIWKKVTSCYLCGACNEKVVLHVYNVNDGSYPGPFGQQQTVFRFRCRLRRTSHRNLFKV